HGAYLAGSVPLDRASEVFRTVSGALSPVPRWIPGGETGPNNWVMRFEPVFARHPHSSRATGNLNASTSSAGTTRIG
ncbi:MAG: hypothetical protein IT514_02745, partial [Burkholderiales bacterium]|nr:hypothetical protein [Burkholderiales bacterium]